LLRIIPAVNHVASNRTVLSRGFEAIPEPFEVSKKIDTRGGARFDFNGLQFLALFDEEIDFQSAGLPIMQ